MLAEAKKFVGAAVGIAAGYLVVNPLLAHKDPVELLGSVFGALVLVLVWDRLVAPAIPE